MNSLYDNLDPSRGDEIRMLLEAFKRQRTMCDRMIMALEAVLENQLLYKQAVEILEWEKKHLKEEKAEAYDMIREKLFNTPVLKEEPETGKPLPSPPPPSMVPWRYSKDALP